MISKLILPLSIKVRNSNSLGKITFPNLSKSFFATGMIMPFGKNTGIPPGWLLCNGTRFGEEVYPDLFAVIGNSYDATSEAGTFCVPTLTMVDANSKTVYYIIKT
jgi:microcystin-dependent protein